MTGKKGAGWCHLIIVLMAVAATFKYNYSDDIHASLLHMGIHKFNCAILYTLVFFSLLVFTGSYSATHDLSRGAQFYAIPSAVFDHSHLTLTLEYEVCSIDFQRYHPAKHVPVTTHPVHFQGLEKKETLHLIPACRVCLNWRCNNHFRPSIAGWRLVIILWPRAVIYSKIHGHFIT